MSGGSIDSRDRRSTRCTADGRTVAEDDERTRRVRRQLREYTDAVTVGELADVVHQNDGGDLTARADVHEDIVERILPALDEAGAITFDEERGVVDVPSRRGHGAGSRVGGIAGGAPVRTVVSALVLIAVVVGAATGADPTATVGGGGTALVAVHLTAWLRG